MRLCALPNFPLMGRIPIVDVVPGVGVIAGAPVVLRAGWRRRARGVSE